MYFFLNMLSSTFFEINANKFNSFFSFFNSFFKNATKYYVCVLFISRIYIIIFLFIGFQTYISQLFPHNYAVNTHTDTHT